MKFRIENQTKARIVKYGQRLFGRESKNLDHDGLVALFDRVWAQGLRQQFEEAIAGDVSVTPEVVIDRMEGGGMSPSVRFVDTSGRKTLYECTHKVLCVAQITSDDEEHTIDQMWFFTYGERKPEVFCFPFASEQEKKTFQEFAQRTGADPQVHARILLVRAMEERLAALQRVVDSLGAEVERLRADATRSTSAYFTACLDEFERRLSETHPESSGDTSWQRWIRDNSWIFGVRYGSPLTQARVGLSTIPDFLFPTMDGGFLDILEIKLPKEDVLVEDRSHRGAFYWSSAVSGAIGQVVNYLHEIDANQYMLDRRYSDDSLNVRIARPRAFILIGRSTNWSDAHRRIFRRLNHSLHGIEVITYDDLLARARQIAILHAR